MKSPRAYRTPRYYDWSRLHDSGAVTIRNHPSREVDRSAEVAAKAWAARHGLKVTTRWTDGGSLVVEVVR